MLKNRKNSTSGQSHSRPRRFSLLYSSSDEEDEYDNDILKQRRKSKSISKTIKSDIKMTALRNKLKLLQKVNTSDNIDNSLQSNVKKRNNNVLNIPDSSSSDVSSDNSDEEPQQKQIGNKNTTTNNSNVKLATTTPEIEASTSKKSQSKKLESTSDELNEDDLIKAIESESDVEKDDNEDVNYLDIDLDQNFDDFINKQNNDSNEIFSNVAIDSLTKQSNSSLPKDDANMFVLHDDDDDEENDQDMKLILQADKTPTNKEDESDEDYDEMLLEAALLTDSENNSGHHMINVSNNTSDNEVDNVFINVDDLDPHSFYFEDMEDSDLENTNKHVMDLDFDTRVPEKDTKKKLKSKAKDEVVHRNAFFQDEESTDEEDTLPAVSKKIKTRTRSFHNSHDVHHGKALPKLNSWKTDKKRPFSIIDGLSTKSLFSITIVDETKPNGMNTVHDLMNHNLLTPAAKMSAGGDNVTNNVKINMHEKLLAEASSLDNTPKTKQLSEVESKNDDFPMDQLLAISSGSEKEHDFVDSSATNSDLDIPNTKAETEEIEMIIHKDNSDENDLFTKDAMESLINNEVIIEIPSEMNFHPLEQFRRNSVSELQPHLASLDTFYQNNEGGLRRGSFVKDRFRNNSVMMDNSDLELIQKLTKNSSSDLQQAQTTSQDMKKKDSVMLDEAKGEKMRYTKSGMFSEAAMNSLEEFVHTNANKVTKNRRFSTNQSTTGNADNNETSSNIVFEIDNFTF